MRFRFQGGTVKPPRIIDAMSIGELLSQISEMSHRIEYSYWIRSAQSVYIEIGDPEMGEGLEYDG